MHLMSDDIHEQPLSTIDCDECGCAVSEGFIYTDPYENTVCRECWVLAIVEYVESAMAKYERIYDKNADNSANELFADALKWVRELQKELSFNQEVE